MPEQTKSIFILKSAVRRNIHLELTYSNLCISVETDIGPPAPSQPGSPSEGEIGEVAEDGHTETPRQSR
jgi:hypothetical protein